MTKILSSLLLFLFFCTSSFSQKISLSDLKILKKKEDSLTNISLRSSKKRRILSVKSVTLEVTILKKRTVDVRVLEDYLITNFNISDTSSEKNKIFLSKAKNDINYNINSKDQQLKINPRD